MRWKLAGLLPALCLAGAAHAAPANWNFRVLLGDSEIGEHRFTLTGQGEQRQLRSEAAFAVKLLGVTVYRYRHEATERWAGDCLAGLSARTDDNGTPLSVDARRDGDDLNVRSPEGEARVEGCVMSFAYWNPAMLRQKRLLNAQSGKLESVRIRLLGKASIDVRGRSVPAVQYAIEGLERPIALWYSEAGDWLALESTVAGNRRLRYLLQ